MSSIVNIDELSRGLGVDLDPESTRGIHAQLALDDATALAKDAAGITTEWDDTDDAPEIAKMVVRRAAVRAMSSPEGAMPDVSLLPSEYEKMRRLADHDVHSLQLDSGFGLRASESWLPDIT